MDAVTDFVGITRFHRRPDLRSSFSDTFALRETLIRTFAVLALVTATFRKI